MCVCVCVCVCVYTCVCVCVCVCVYTHMCFSCCQSLYLSLTWSVQISSRYEHTSAYVSIRHLSDLVGADLFAVRGRDSHHSVRHLHSAYVSIRQHTAAYVSIRQHPSAYLYAAEEGLEALAVIDDTFVAAQLRLHCA